MAYITFQPTDHYKTLLYTGTGSSNAQTFPETTAMQPDFTWLKNRTAADEHLATNAVIGATKYVVPNDVDAQTTKAETLKSFDSDGFTVGTYETVNTNTENYVSWNWKAGTTTGIAGSPSITPTAYSFNATSGFSIISYTGTGSVATLPHGLGVAPDCIMIKKLNATASWVNYANTWLMGNTKAMHLNTTAIVATELNAWNSTSPTSTLFTIGSEADVNSSSDTFIAYCFSNTKGFSHTGEYRGNGNATQPPFIFTGFRPGFVIFKVMTNTPAGWFMFDNKRQVFNGGPGGNLVADDNAAEATGTGGTKGVDYYSNGFRVPYTADTAMNGDGYGYMYMAFGASPFVSSNDIPATAN